MQSVPDRGMLEEEDSVEETEEERSSQKKVTLSLLVLYKY